jgi:UDP-glucose 4-epimerase
MGTEVVLKFAQRYRARVLLASSSEVYGKGLAVPFREDDDIVLGPTSSSRWAYAASKMVDEFLALAYLREKDLPVTVVRLFNTIGARQTGRYGMVIPRFVQQALQGQPLTVFGDGQQTRCFMHVRDAVAALLALAGCEQAIGQVFNAGSVEEISVLKLARLVVAEVTASNGGPASARSAETGKEEQDPAERFVFIPYEQAYAEGFDDMRRRVPDITKIQRFTGWAPRSDLRATLRDVIAAHRSSA